MQNRGYAKVNERVVFVHGAGGGAWEWAIWQRVFAAQRWRVSANDLLPVEGSPARTCLQDYARQVESWMRREESDDAHDRPKRTVLVGASLGGLLSMMVAERVAPAALVLINPLPPAGIEPRPARKNYPDIVSWRSARSFASTRRALPDADDAARWLAFRRWRDEAGAVLREAIRGIAVGAVACPVLVLASENDTDVAPAASRALADTLNAEFRLLHGAGHLAPLMGNGASVIAQRAADWCEDALAQV
jgi:pimeloyl-ACP methyl ester carboxylesterase